jgi:hypothetical protein
MMARIRALMQIVCWALGTNSEMQFKLHTGWPKSSNFADSNTTASQLTFAVTLKFAITLQVRDLLRQSLSR